MLHSSHTRYILKEPFGERKRKEIEHVILLAILHEPHRASGADITAIRNDLVGRDYVKVHCAI